MTQPATCSHGREGFCHDDATPEQRTAFDEAHRFAYAWAMSVHVDRDDAEVFAGDYAQASYLWPVEDWSSASSAFADYERRLGRRPDLETKPFVPTCRYRRGRAA